MRKKRPSDIELRSEKVRNLLGEIPPSLVKWGTVIIVAIFLALLLVVCFVPYPHSHGEKHFTAFIDVIFEIWLQKEHATGWIMLADYLDACCNI